MKGVTKSSILHPVHLSLLGLEIALGIVLSFTSLAFYAKLLQKTLAEEMVFFDNLLWQILFAARSPAMTFLMNLVTNLGGEILLLSAIIIGFYLWDKRMKHEAIFFPAIFISSTIIYKFLKIMVARPRPNIAPLAYHSDFSFPSGHSMNSFVFFATLSYLYYHRSRDKKMAVIFSVISALIILLVGISRVYLGVHWATDVLAGYLSGLCWFTMAVAIDKTIILIKMRNKKL